MKKNILSLSIAAMIGGLGFAASYYSGTNVVIVPQKDLNSSDGVYYQGVVYTLLEAGWI